MDDSNRSVDNGPSRAERGAGSDGSIPRQRAAPPRDSVTTADRAPAADSVNTADSAKAVDTYLTDPYCAVTIVCGHRQLDVALPTAVSLADLLPGLLRLLLPDEPPGDEQPADAQPWGLTPIGGTTLAGSETLSEAGVLVGDVLVLEQHPVLRRADSALHTTRDRIEDVVNGQARFWGPPASRSLAQWTALLTGAVLLVPAVNMRASPAAALMAATVAVTLTMAAVLSGRRHEKVCAAVGLTLGCGWAALAGADVVQGWLAARLPEAVVDPVTMMAATGSALLLAGCAATASPPALVHTTALLVVGIACAGLVIAVDTGATVRDAGCAAALLAVLLLGGLSRFALATGGLTGSDTRRASADLDDRITRADRVLTGCVIGAGLVAAGGVVPAALAGDGGSRALAVGIGSLLLLRSRTYSQTRHVLAPRMGGLLVFGAVWLGVYRGDAVPQSALIIGAAVAGGAFVVVIDMLERVSSPVGLARRGRILDLAEQLLVVALIVLAAWVIVLGGWVGSVVG